MNDRNVFVTGGFFTIQSRTIRFLEEAAKLGRVHVLLWAEESDPSLPGDSVKLTLPERHYVLTNNR